MKSIYRTTRQALLALLFLSLPLSAWADPDDYHMGYGYMPMMGGGMMGGGMMGGGMMGGGMMGMGPIYMLDLSDAQLGKIRDIRNALRRSHFDAMEKISDQYESLWKLYRADNRDPKAIGAAYGKIFSIQQKMIESTVAQQNRMEAVLTKEQREQLRAWRNNMGMGYMGHGGRGYYRDREGMHRGMMGR
jgi:Spy/CpxP family protein refolding chaperone